jgi:hypothetical protein
MQERRASEKWSSLEIFLAGKQKQAHSVRVYKEEKEMKKAIIIAAAALASASAFSQVSSANVVGYIKDNTPASGAYDIVSLGILGDSDTVDLQQAVANMADLHASGSILGNAAGAIALADKLHVWNGSGYTTYGLYAGTSSNFWMSSASIGWSKAGSAAPSSATITRGSGVWFQTATGASSTNLLAAGEVPNDGTYEIALPGEYSLIAYPYASTINLQQLVVSNATASGSILGNAAGAIALADKIHVWSGSGYTTYGLYAGTSSNFWMSSASIGWSKAGSAAPSSANIDLGKGIWYQSVDGAKTIGFTQNYNLD